MSGQSLTRTTFFTGASKGVEGFGSVVATLMVARYLGPAGYGVYAQLVSMAMLLWPLVDMGLDHVVVRDLVSGSGRGTVMGSALALRLSAGALFSVGMAIWMLHSAPEGEMLAATILAAANILMVRQLSNLICRAFFLGIEHVENDLMATAVGQVVRLGGLWMTIRMDTGLLGILAVPIAAEIVQIVIGLALARPFLRGARIRIAGSEIRHLLGQSWSLLLRLTMVTAYFHIDTVVMGKLLPAEEVGLFAAPFRLVAGLVAVVVPTAWSLLPSIVRNRGERASPAMMRRVGMIASGITAAVGAAFVLAAWPLIRMTFGAGYEASESVVCLRLLGMMPAMHTVAYIMELELLARGRQQWALASAGPALALKVALDVCLAPSWGPLTGAISTVAADVVRVAILVIVTRSRWMARACIPIVGLGIMIAVSLVAGF